MGYQIKMVSEMLGIPKNTLIAWERRYAIVDPSRTDSGYRVYSDADVERLRRVQALLDQGYKVGEACGIVLEENVHQLAPAVVERGVPETDRAALAQLREELSRHLLAFDREAADRVSGRLVLVPYEQVIDEVYFPLLREVGHGWELGRITVVQEHFASAWCREKLLVMLNAVQAGTRDAPEVTCATPPGEQHELGLLGLALRLAIRGFRVTYLGVNVPTSELIEHVNERRPVALCLSVIHRRPLGELQDYARELRRRIDRRVRIAVGGRAADEDLGVDGVSFVGHGLPGWLDNVRRVGRA
ncbi:MAG: MerR family transcriptional regulator [Alphaproteobacteria bacterium]|nr:MerR family transcriptional regulator [Alphaproteobacteria bacterium]